MTRSKESLTPSSKLCLLDFKVISFIAVFSNIVIDITVLFFNIFESKISPSLLQPMILDDGNSKFKLEISSSILALYLKDVKI